MLKKKIEKLISLIENTEIEEIEVSSFWGAQKIKLSKSKKREEVVPPPFNGKDSINSTTSEPALGNVNPNPIIVEEEESELHSIQDNAMLEDENYEDESQFRIIKSPLVGTFYSSPKPENPAFISIGDNIDTNDIVCIIEAMKIFNEIESDFNGELVHIYVQDGTPVEYGQELFALRIKNV